jgi:hypothetical protein
MSYREIPITSYSLLITSKLKTVGVGDLARNAPLGLCPSGAISQDKPLPQLNTTCNGWGLKPLNLR